MIALSIKDKPVLQAFGLLVHKRRDLFWFVPAMIAGLVLAILVRNHFSMGPLPGLLTRVALITPVIGMAEEAVFRGYLQGHLRPIGWFFSVVYASAAHTCYKLLVILTLSHPLPFDFFFLLCWTFLGGLLFGAFRELSRNTWPSMIAHGTFDILLYGGMILVPAWVWS
jgi:membrane protease YdiL (CAAX protease family)